jgi:elongation factor Ts
MAVTADMVKTLRARTGAGIMDCRKALEDANGDLDRAIEIIKAKGLATAAKRADRAASEGVVEAYVHAGNRLGALVELNCETDFVARTEDFRALAKELAMQVAAASPRYLSKDDVPAEVLVEQRAAFQADQPSATDAELDRRLAQWMSEVALLEQPYIRDAGKKVGEMVTDAIARTGENVRVRRFSRFKLGE